jgi:atrophin-1 interacting protein 3 (BAI1-associated protein 1)
VGHIVAGGAADMDGRIRSGDEIMSVDGFSVLKASHRQVVRLMNAAAARGQVTLVVRRRVFPQPMIGPYSMGVNWPHENPPPPPASHLPVISPPHSEGNYDVTVQRNENEGFGFVIISSANKQGSTIGGFLFVGLGFVC